MKKLISTFLIVTLALILITPHSAFATEYTLDIGDILEIRVIGRGGFEVKQAIAPDGSISLPFLGRVIAKGQTLEEFESFISLSLSKHIKNSHIVVFLTPRPIYVIQHDVKKNTWDVKEAKSVEEARAYLGPPDKGDIPIKHGDVLSIDVSRKPDFFEVNWYKIITAGAVLVGIYATLNR